MKRMVRFKICVAHLAVLLSLLLQSSQGACPSHCQSSEYECYDEPDDGCPQCYREYYGRQCDLRMECRFSTRGTEFRGFKNTTVSGVICQRWDTNYPHISSFRTDENYCRNPDNWYRGPWCYTTDPGLRYDICGIPFCSQQCKQPKLPPGASVMNPATPGEGFFLGFILNIMCPDGAQSQSTCSQNGNSIDWSYFTCPEINCAYPSNLEKSYMQPRKLQYVYGDYVNVLCDTGYETTNKTQFRCQKDTMWDGIFPTCTAVRCQEPRITPNTHVTLPKSIYVYQDEITIECNTGYEPESQSKNTSKHTCQANQMWDGDFLTCHVVKCAEPNLNNVTRISSYSRKSEYIYHDQISLICESGYELATNINKFNCSEQKLFYPPVPNCTAVECPMVEVSFAVYNPRATTFFFKDVVKVECLEGFTTNTTDKNFACLADKTWNGTFPACSRKTCKGPMLTNNIRLSNTTGLFFFEDAQLVQCNEGFEMKGEARITCLADQTWSKIPTCTAIEAGSHTLGTVLGVIVAFVAVTIVVILFIVWRRKRLHRKPSGSGYKDPDVQQNNKISKEVSPTAGADLRYNTYVNVSEVSDISKVDLIEETDDEDMDPPFVHNNDTNEYYNFVPRKIQISCLSEYVQKKKDEDFFSDFVLLKSNLQRPTEAARMPQNRNKNKYKNIYPYDDNRVVLDTSKSNNCSYINASPILGSKGKEKFIAAQGPIASSLVDFWRMIWQKKIKKIVMLTAPIENGKLKCVEYWPKFDKTMMVGDLTLKLQSEDEYADFIVRRINIKTDDKNHTVVQYFYLVWPDKSVPSCSGSLAIFHRKTCENTKDTDPPTLVHCSAGIGRTGTFIALDLLLEQALIKGEVEPFKCVEELRRQRVNMVQTAEQYLFLHTELVKAWKVHTCTKPIHEFEEHYRWLKKVDRAKDKTNLTLEFEAIADPVFKADPYEAGNYTGNISKNRFQDILPVEAYRPYLPYASCKYDNYINAVFLPNFKQKNHFIITQTPLKNTVDDFFKLIEQEEVVTIVNLTQSPDSSCGNYFNSVGKYDITTCECKETSKGIFSTEFQVTNNVKTFNVREFSINFWPDNESVPDSPSSFMDLLREVSSWQGTKSDAPIIVHCMNGACKSGLYCVLAYLMERLQSEQDVMLPIIVEHMRMRRPQILRSQDQYDFCYQCVENYCKMFETYANFK